MRYYRRTSSDEESVVYCGCGLLLLVFNMLVGSWSVNYLLALFLDKTIPWIGAAAIGLIAGELTVPVAVICTILKWAGIL